MSLQGLELAHKKFLTSLNRNRVYYQNIKLSYIQVLLGLVYLKLVNGQIKKQEYNEILVSMNPPLAVGPAVVFRDNYTNLIGFIKGVNPKATILVSAIIPRPWDHERRHLVRVCYNNLLKKFNSPSDNVYFLPTYNPFFDKSKNLKQDLYNVDGIHLSVLGSIVL